MFAHMKWNLTLSAVFHTDRLDLTESAPVDVTSLLIYFLYQYNTVFLLKQRKDLIFMNKLCHNTKF